MFDYIFFSVYNFYQSKNSGMSNEFATNYVSIIQAMILFYLFPILSFFFDTRVLIKDFEIYIGFDFKFIILVPGLILLYYNNRKYKHKKIGYDNFKIKAFKSPIFGLLMVLLPLVIFTGMIF